MICPVDIRPDRNPTDPDCLRCLDCTLCPSLKLTTVFQRQPFDTRKATLTCGENGLMMPRSH